MNEEQLSFTFNFTGQGNSARSNHMPVKQNVVFAFPTSSDICTRKFRIILEKSEAIINLNFGEHSPTVPIYTSRFHLQQRARKQSIFSMPSQDITGFLKAICLAASNLSDANTEEFIAAYANFEQTLRQYKKNMSGLPGPSILAIEACLDEIPDILEFAKRGRKEVTPENVSAQLPFSGL